MAEDHHIVGIRYEADVISALCSCGKKTDGHATEDEAREAHELHVKESR